MQYHRITNLHKNQTIYKDIHEFLSYHLTSIDKNLDKHIIDTNLKSLSNSEDARYYIYENTKAVIYTTVGINLMVRNLYIVGDWSDTNLMRIVQYHIDYLCMNTLHLNLMIPIILGSAGDAVLSKFITVYYGRDLYVIDDVAVVKSDYDKYEGKSLKVLYLNSDSYKNTQEYLNSLKLNI